MRSIVCIGCESLNVRIKCIKDFLPPHPLCMAGKTYTANEINHYDDGIDELVILCEDNGVIFISFDQFKEHFEWVELNNFLKLRSVIV